MGNCFGPIKERFEESSTKKSSSQPSTAVTCFNNLVCCCVYNGDSSRERVETPTSSSVASEKNLENIYHPPVALRDDSAAQSRISENANYI